MPPPPSGLFRFLLFVFSAAACCWVFADLRAAGTAFLQGKGEAVISERRLREARQNCLRCHGPASYGRLKGRLNWAGIAFFVDASPKDFAAYVRNPKTLVKTAEMPGNPGYDDATVEALIAYFRTFLPKGKP